MNFVLKNKDNKKEKLVFSIRISQDLAQRIEQALVNTNISRNEFINQAIEYALDHMSDDKPVKIKAEAVLYRFRFCAYKCSLFFSSDQVSFPINKTSAAR